MKRFLGVWDIGYEPTRSEESVEFFTEERGYTPVDIDAINQLLVGETWMDSGPEFHAVMRLPDGDA